MYSANATSSPLRSCKPLVGYPLAAWAYLPDGMDTFTKEIHSLRQQKAHNKQDEDTEYRVLNRHQLGVFSVLQCSRALEPLGKSILPLQQQSS